MNTLPLYQEIWQETLNWSPNSHQQNQFQQVYNLIIAVNQRFNLTRITEINEFWEKHIWDSLIGVLPLFENPSKNLQIIDMGTGAGFPGIAVAIAFSDHNITLVDSTQKKIRFVESVINQLGLKNGKTWCDRAEFLGHNPQYREQYDMGLIRAVGKVSVCAEYTLPFLKVGGLGILYRGQWTNDDTENLATVVNKLGGEIEKISSFKTPLSHGERTCIYVRKIAPTKSQFPRGVNIPNQNPL